MSDIAESSDAASHLPPAIKVRGLSTAFGSHVIHENLDMEVRRGEIMGLIGGSGTGKSVLLNTILGLNAPRSGSVELFGFNIHDPAQRGEAERRIGVLFQNGALFSALTVRENVEAPMVEHTEMPSDFIAALAAFKLRLVGLPEEAGEKRPSELSGGMRKRAGIARAIALDPPLLFLDEPTAGLDPLAAEEFDQLICALRDALKLTVLMVTHDLDTIHAVCDRVSVLADRRVVACGTVEQLRHSDHPWIKRYFGGPRGRAAEGASKESS